MKLLPSPLNFTCHVNHTPSPSSPRHQRETTLPSPSHLSPCCHVKPTLPLSRLHLFHGNRHSFTSLPHPAHGTTLLPPFSPSPSRETHVHPATEPHSFTLPREPHSFNLSPSPCHMNHTASPLSPSPCHVNHTPSPLPHDHTATEPHSFTLSFTNGEHTPSPSHPPCHATGTTLLHPLTFTLPREPHSFTLSPSPCHVNHTPSPSHLHPAREPLLHPLTTLHVNHTPSPLTFTLHVNHTPSPSHLHLPREPTLLHPLTSPCHAKPHSFTLSPSPCVNHAPSPCHVKPHSFTLPREPRSFTLPNRSFTLPREPHSFTLTLSPCHVNHAPSPLTFTCHVNHTPSPSYTCHVTFHPLTFTLPRELRSFTLSLSPCHVNHTPSPSHLHP
ncbi:hypothetical protein C7M84_020085 [Penaeus vannamei]|uniref:Uncharacterized protein n=1 Tax=Penaeus vannamei TaxID=6689 RepID=A0A423SD48_PENVA|nr:hypothetical protein C7M84_020085 [Penaeus vannamei]